MVNDRFARTTTFAFLRTLVWLVKRAVVWPVKKTLVWLFTAVVWLGAQGWHRVTPLMTPRKSPRPARALERLRLVLDSAGIVVAGAAFAYWRGLSDFSVSSALGYWVNGIAQAVIVALIVLCLSCLILLGLHRSGSRAALFKELLHPLGVAAGYCAGVIVPMLVFGWAAQQQTSPPLLVVLLPVEVFWFGAFLHASILAGRHFFRAEEVHPALGSFCLIGVGLWSLFASVRNLTQDGLNPAYPSWAALLLGFAGPTAIVVLAAWDVIRQQASGHLRGRIPIMLSEPTGEAPDFR